MTVPAVGDLAPGFTTRNQHGEVVTRDDLLGTPVALVFFPYAFSGICTRELREIRDHRAAFDRAGVRVAGVSCDAMFTLRTFDDQDAYGFDLLSDHWPHGAIAEAYGVFDREAGCARRGTFLLDAHGRITWSVVRDLGTPRPIADLLAALTEP